MFAVQRWFVCRYQVTCFFASLSITLTISFPVTGVQVPPVGCLTDRLGEVHFVLQNPFRYGGYPVFANIEAGCFRPLAFASATIAGLASLDNVPKLLGRSCCCKSGAPAFRPTFVFENWTPGASHPCRPRQFFRREVTLLPGPGTSAQ